MPQKNIFLKFGDTDHCEDPGFSTSQYSKRKQEEEKKRKRKRKGRGEEGGQAGARAGATETPAA